MAKREQRKERIVILLTPSQKAELEKESYESRKSVGRIVRERVFQVDETPEEDDGSEA